MTNQVSKMTSGELKEKESVIERGKVAFIEVGLALMEIRDKRGYKLTGYETFEVYCKDRWGWSTDSAYGYIGAAQVAKKIPTQVGILEFSQARELSRLSNPAPNGDKRRKEIDGGFPLLQAKILRHFTPAEHLCNITS